MSAAFMGPAYSMAAGPPRLGDNPPMTSRRITVLAALMAMANAFPAAAAHYTVDSLEALQAKVNSAAPGDVITLKDGVYSTTAPIAITGKGTAKSSIGILAQTPGGVTIEGSDGFD